MNLEKIEMGNDIFTVSFSSIVEEEAERILYNYDKNNKNERRIHAFISRVILRMKTNTPFIKGRQSSDKNAQKRYDPLTKRCIAKNAEYFEIPGFAGLVLAKETFEVINNDKWKNTSVKRSPYAQKNMENQTIMSSGNLVFSKGTKNALIKMKLL
jgi:hypothetical protein